MQSLTHSLVHSHNQSLTRSLTPHSNQPPPPHQTLSTMNKFVACIAVIAMLAACAFASYTTAHNEVTFESWLNNNQRDYANQDKLSFNAFQYELRREIFKTNMKTIQQHNARYEAGEETWFMKPTQFADLTQEEFEAKHLGFDKSTSSSSSSGLRSFSASTTIKDFQPIDWKKKGLTPEVVNQGGCGSCWANAATGALSAAALIQLGDKTYPSREQLTKCTKNPLECGGTGGCSGATAQLGFQNVIEMGGVYSEKDWAYTASDGKCTPPAGKSAAFTIEGYAEVEPNNKKALYDALKIGPVSVSAYASSWSFYAGGIFSGAKCNSVNVNHAILLTAMDYDAQANMYYYTIQNSWGNWGEGGFMRLYASPPEVEETCAQDTAPFDGSACKKDPNPPRTLACGCCGILYDSAYPVGIRRA